MNNEDLHCHYSDLPSPSAYLDDTMDYDGIGNNGRFPKNKLKTKSRMKRIIQKIIFWLSIIKPKRERKSPWNL